MGKNAEISRFKKFQFCEKFSRPRRRREKLLSLEASYFFDESHAAAMLC